MLLVKRVGKICSSLKGPVFHAMITYEPRCIFNVYPVTCPNGHLMSVTHVMPISIITVDDGKY